jgi:hypothetical protein
MLSEITLPLPADELELATGAGFGIHPKGEPQLEMPAAAAEGAVVVRELPVQDGMELDRSAVETARRSVWRRTHLEMAAGFVTSVHELSIALGMGLR